MKCHPAFYLAEKRPNIFIFLFHKVTCVWLLYVKGCFPLHTSLYKGDRSSTPHLQLMLYRFLSNNPIMDQWFVSLQRCDAVARLLTSGCFQIKVLLSTAESLAASTDHRCDTWAYADQNADSIGLIPSRYWSALGTFYGYSIRLHDFKIYAASYYCTVIDSIIKPSRDRE